MRITALIAIFFLMGWGLTSAWGQQRVVVYPEENKLCLAYKIRGRNYIIEDGKILYKGKEIFETQNSCFIPPIGFCPLGTRVEMVFLPQNLHRYFKKSVDFTLTGRVVWRKKGKDRQKMLSCFPTGKSEYRGDAFTIKIESYPELQRLFMAIPYVANVQTKDAGLLQVIKPYVKKCHPGDITCLVYNSYNTVIQNLSYKKDPYTRGGDYIRSPIKTIQDRGGDCEDLTGVLVSFLANLKVESYVLMTSDHAYAMACGIFPDRLQEYIRTGLERSISRKEKKNLKYGRWESYYFGLTRNKSRNREKKMKWHISVQSQNPFNFLIVSGRVGVSQLRSKNFNQLNYHKQCSGFNITVLNTTCELGPEITLIFGYGTSFPGQAVSENLGQPNNLIEFSLRGDYNLADFNQVAVHYYPLKKNGQVKYCVVLEPTAGAEGYPGFSRVKNQWSVAVSPDTWEWFYLKNPQAIYQ